MACLITPTGLRSEIETNKAHTDCSLILIETSTILIQTSKQRRLFSIFAQNCVDHIVEHILYVDRVGGGGEVRKDHLVRVGRKRQLPKVCFDEERGTIGIVVGSGVLLDEVTKLAVGEDDLFAKQVQLVEEKKLMAR